MIKSQWWTYLISLLGKKWIYPILIRSRRQIKLWIQTRDIARDDRSLSRCYGKAISMLTMNDIFCLYVIYFIMNDWLMPLYFIDISLMKNWIQYWNTKSFIVSFPSQQISWHAMLWQLDSGSFFTVVFLSKLYSSANDFHLDLKGKHTEVSVCCVHFAMYRSIFDPIYHNVGSIQCILGAGSVARVSSCYGIKINPLNKRIFCRVWKHMI